MYKIIQMTKILSMEVLMHFAENGDVLLSMRLFSGIHFIQQNSM